MKVKIEYVDTDDVVIKTNKNNKHISEIKNYIESIKEYDIRFYKNNLEVYLDINEIIFFDKEDNYVCAHTINNVYKVKQKLYELENILPKNYIRVSKSTIINKNQIHTITKNVTKPGIITFKDTHKKTYISRMYYKKIKEELK